MAHKLNQRGFSALEAVLIVIVLGIIGSTGYFVYHANKNTDNTLNSAAKVAQSSPATKQKTTANSNVATVQATPTAPVSTTDSKLPVALQAAVLADFTARAPGCVKNGTLVGIDGSPIDPEATYIANGYAIVGVGCDSPAATLFVLTGDKWQDVASTESAFTCSVLQQYAVPSALLAALAPGVAVRCATGTALQVYSD